MRNLILLSLVSLTVAVGSFSSADAQVVYGDPFQASARFIYQSWTVDDDISGNKFDLSQWYFPVFALVPIYDNTEIHLSTATAGSSTDSTGNDISLTGLNDTRLSVLHSVYNDRLLLGMGLNLPTGKTRLDQNETVIGELLTADFLSLPAKRYGEGFGVYLEGAYAEKISNITLGGGLGYLLNSSYSPSEDVDSYDPGNRFVIAVNGSVDHQYGDVYAYVRYNYFGIATQDGVDVYKIGPIAEISLGSNVLYQNFRLHGGFRVLLRGADERLVEGNLVKFEENNNGSEFRFFSDLGYNLRNIGLASILLDYKHVSANGLSESSDLYEGKASLFGIGAAFERVLTENFIAGAQFKSYSGSANDGDVSLSGLELGVTLRLIL
jgi:hypothetical protein